ncbi:MAG: nucleotide exchange factor GrpE [Victivallaceae bacterium]
MSKEHKKDAKHEHNHAPEEVVEEQKVEAPQVTTPEDTIKALETALALEQDKLLRLQAEFQNYRKRAAKEISNARIVGLTETIMPFLQVFDHFNMAVIAAGKSDNMDAIRQGLEMILTEYSKALEELGVERIDAIGEIFNPEHHEAIAEEASEEIEEGRVLKQWSCGYKMGEKLLRPAGVVVSSGPTSNNEQE